MRRLLWILLCASAFGQGITLFPKTTIFPKSTLFPGVAAAPSPVFVNAAHVGGYNNTAPGSTTTNNFTLTAGNALIVACEDKASTAVTVTPSDTAGNTFGSPVLRITDANGDAGDISVYVVLNAIGNASDAVSCNINATAYIAAMAIQFSGIPTSSALDATASGTVTNPPVPINASITTGAFSTTQANEVAIAFSFLGGGNGETFTAGTGYTIPAGGNNTGDTNGGTAAVEYQIFTSTQSGVTASETVNTATYWQLALVTLK